MTYAEDGKTAPDLRRDGAGRERAYRHRETRIEPSPARSSSTPRNSRSIRFVSTGGDVDGRQDLGHHRRPDHARRDQAGHREGRVHRRRREPGPEEGRLRGDLRGEAVGLRHGLGREEQGPRRRRATGGRTRRRLGPDDTDSVAATDSTQEPTHRDQDRHPSRCSFPMLAGGGLVALCWLLPPLRKWRVALARVAFGLGLAVGGFASFVAENGVPPFPPTERKPSGSDSPRCSRRCSRSSGR